MTKSRAFVTGVVTISLFGILEYLFPGRNAHVASLFTAIVGLVTAFFTLQTINNGVKGKFFEPRLQQTDHGFPGDTGGADKPRDGG